METSLACRLLLLNPTSSHCTGRGKQIVCHIIKKRVQFYGWAHGLNIRDDIHLWFGSFFKVDKRGAGSLFIQRQLMVFNQLQNIKFYMHIFGGDHVGKTQWRELSQSLKQACQLLCLSTEIWTNWKVKIRWFELVVLFGTCPMAGLSQCISKCGVMQRVECLSNILLNLR